MIESLVREPLRWMEDRPHHRSGIRMLQLFTGICVLYRLATEARFAFFLWGPNGIATGSATLLFGAWVGSALDIFFRSNSGVVLFLLAITLAAIGYVAGFCTRLATLTLAVGFTVLTVRSPFLVDSGDSLISIVLCYLILVLPRKRESKPGRWQTWLHNVGVVAITMQTVIVYATAGLWKTSGRFWMEGTALYYVGQVAEFSEPSLRWLFANAILVNALTWGTILFQLWFPIAIFSRFRIPWLICAMCMHVGIAVFMGLVSFSLVMIGVDLFLITDPEYEVIAAALSRASAGVRHLSRA
ncbi:MAG: hypothetical protein ABI718_09480 [Acidobacteriota bacterium]